MFSIRVFTSAFFFQWIWVVAVLSAPWVVLVILRVANRSVPLRKWACTCSVTMVGCFFWGQVQVPSAACDVGARTAIFLAYNVYQDTSDVAAWEECFSKTMDLIGMRRALSRRMSGRFESHPVRLPPPSLLYIFFLICFCVSALACLLVLSIPPFIRLFIFMP